MMSGGRSAAKCAGSEDEGRTARTRLNGGNRRQGSDMSRDEAGRPDAGQSRRIRNGSAGQDLAQHGIERAQLTDTALVVGLARLADVRCVFGDAVRLVPERVSDRDVLRNQQQHAQQGNQVETGFGHDDERVVYGLLGRYRRRKGNDRRREVDRR